MADLSWIGANMLEYLKARSRRSVAPAESDAADSGTAAPLVPRHQIDLLQFVLDNMAEGVMVCDRDLHLVQFNRGASAIMGADLRGDDLRNTADRYMLLPSRGAPPIALEQWPLARAMKGEAVDNAQFILRGLAMASDVWIEAFARPVRTDDGTILGGMMVLRDISERKALDGLKHEFIAMVSHELGTPLTAIGGHAQLMRRRGKYDEGAIDAIVDASGQLGRLIQDLLLASRLEAGRIELQRADVDLVMGVKAAVSQGMDILEVQGAVRKHGSCWAVQLVRLNGSIRRHIIQGVAVGQLRFGVPTTNARCNSRACCPWRRGRSPTGVRIGSADPRHVGFSPNRR